MNRTEKHIQSRRRHIYAPAMQDYHVLSKVSILTRGGNSESQVTNTLSTAVADLQKAVEKFNVMGKRNNIPAIATIKIAGVNLTIDPSLPSLINDPFIVEKTRRAELQFSNKTN